jgi:hypothetical protein
MCIEVYQVEYYSIQSFTMCTLASDSPSYALQPTHNCPHVSISSDIGRPHRITDVNSDIVVIDRTFNDGVRVVVLGMEGNVKWIYQGIVHYSIQSFTMCTLASALPLYVIQPTHNCPDLSISSDVGYITP